MERFEDKTKVTNFAQLALDCYNDPKDDDVRNNEFNRLWRKVDQWPRKDDYKLTTDVNGSVDYDMYTGFYAAFYVNTATGVGAIAIRGTSMTTNFTDYIADGDYVFDKVVDQYDEALKFVKLIQNSFQWSALKKKYVCGHSLGGILAKMIAPRTGLDTIAFNSPGVVQYLKKRKLPYIRAPFSDARCSIPQRQTIITYCANGCPIGNLRHDNDVGPYKWLPVLGEKRIPDQDDRIKNVVGNDALAALFPSEFVKTALSNLLDYHKMGDMYAALKKSNYSNDRI